MFDALFRSDPLARRGAPFKADLVALILRLSLAAVFVYHGIDKIATAGNDWGANWAQKYWRARPELMPRSLTYPATQYAVAWGELLGGLALAAGVLTRVAAAGLILIQAGAVALVTYSRGFAFERGGGYEYNLALLAMCASVLVLGGGLYSVDRLCAARAARAQAGPAGAGAPATEPSLAGR